MLIKIDTQEYPVSEKDFKSRFPNISFPVQVNYSDYGYAVVFPSPQPECSYKEISREIQPEFMTEKGWYEQRWEKIDFTLSMTTEEFDAFNARLKQAKLDQLAALRYEKETAGIEINGTKIRTDRETQSRLDSAQRKSESDPDLIVDWKGENGWVELTSPQIIAIGNAAFSHVQACFKRERELSELIDIDIDTDIATGWPN